METREWTVERNGRYLKVRLQHEPGTSVIDVQVNDRPVLLRPERNAFDGSTLYRFPLNGEPAQLTLRARGSHFTYGLEIGTPSQLVTIPPDALPSAASRTELTPPPAVADADPRTESLATRLRPSRSVVIGLATFAGVLLLLTAAFFLLRHQVQWHPHRELTLGFEVTLPPGSPAKSEGQGFRFAPPELAGARVTRLQQDSLKALWSIEVADAPRTLDASALFEKVTEEAKGQGVIRSTKRVGEGSHAALDLDLMTPRGFALVRVVPAGTRLYTLSVTGDVLPSPELRQRFFDSFTPLEGVSAAVR